MERQVRTSMEDARCVLSVRARVGCLICRYCHASHTSINRQEPKGGHVCLTNPERLLDGKYAFHDRRIRHDMAMRRIAIDKYKEELRAAEAAKSKDAASAGKS